MADTGVAGTDRIVRAVEIEGNQAIDDKPIVAGLATRPPAGIVFRTFHPLDPLTLQVDADRIVHFYNTRGYFSAAVTDVDVRDAGDRFVTVRFTVEEGSPARITGVRFEGMAGDASTDVLDPVLDPAERRRLAGAVQVGNVFEHEAYEQAKQRMRTWLVARGHAHAEVDGRVAVNRGANTAQVTFLVQPGPRVRFGQTRIVGLEDVPARAVLVRLAWRPGEIFDPERIELTRARLYELGLFAYVRIDYARAGDPAVADMTIRVTEIPLHDLRLGGGIGVDPRYWELRARASYTRRSFLDPLLMLRLEAMPGYAFRRIEGGRQGPGGRARLTVQRPDLFYPRLYLRSTLSYDQTRTELYQAGGIGSRVEMFRSFFENRLLVGAGWELSALSLSEIAPGIDAPALGLIDPYRNGFFDQRAIYDRRDSIIAPTRGVYADLRLEEGGGFAGGVFSYVRATGELRGYLPVVTPHLVLAGRVRYGRALHGNLPVTRRYFSGGATSHRGFAQDYLSPVPPGIDPAQCNGEDNGEDQARRLPIGGNELLETSAELRWDVVRLWGNWLGVVAFVDGGDVPLEAGDLDLGNLHWAVGGGLRYQTPVGPVRVDVGYRVTRIGESAAGCDRLMFHLTLGEAF